MSIDQELKMLDWKLQKGIISKRDLLLHFNPDMSDEELELKMSEVKDEKDQEIQAEREAQQPVSQIERILNA
jgi:hypothetical protein